MDVFDLEDARDRLEHTFVDVIGPNPRRFGSVSMDHMGISDGNEGVQWSAWIDREPSDCGLGVNLEGKKYEGWPIARFIERELARPRLFDVIGGVSVPDRIGVTWARDYWQQASRPRIREHHIVYRVPLNDLQAEAWHKYLLEAQDCLDRSRGYRGRATQRVTLAASGKQVEGQVSPHLHIAFALDSAFLQAAHRDRVAVLAYARQQLEPLYVFVKQRCS